MADKLKVEFDIGSELKVFLLSLVNKNSGEISNIVSPDNQGRETDGEITRLKGLVEEKERELSVKDAEIIRLNGVVQAKERELFDKDNEITRLNGIVESKDKELSDKGAEITRLNNEISRQNNSVFKQQTELSNLRLDLDAKEDEVKRLTSELSKYNLSSLYNSLSSDVKGKVSHIMKSDNNKLLFFSLLQESNFLNLYELVRDRIINKKTENQSELVMILESVFDYYALAKGCEIIKPSIGDSSASRVHTVKFSDKDEGVISEVMLFGYKDSEGKIVQKALVKVK